MLGGDLQIQMREYSNIVGRCIDTHRIPQPGPLKNWILGISYEQNKLRREHNTNHVCFTFFFQDHDPVTGPSERSSGCKSLECED